MVLIDKYSKEELEQLVQQCNSLSELILKLGYSTAHGNNRITVQKRLEQFQIDNSYFDTTNTHIARNPENIFIENSTASQATLRRWYKKGNYTPYKCSICNLGPEWNGKELTLILDHINGLNKDDRLENLRWVCPNCNQQLETTGYKKIRTTNILEKKYYCRECKKIIHQGSILCPECAAKARRVVDRPNREELKNLIRSTPFTTIGKRYGVSDNTIRKWCDSENLPRLSSEIKKISDEDWKLI